MNETKYYYHFDGLGSVAGLSDVNGLIVERYSYDAFGEPNRTSDIGNPYMFTGRRLDTETGLYYYRARYYKPEIGRFLQTDPIGYAAGLNLYTYCLNNPLNWIDPWGLARIIIYVYKGQPWGQRDKKGGWGHAWFEIIDDYGKRINRGSYPGGLRDDTLRNKKAHISRSYNISQRQYERAKNWVENYGNNNWRRTSENCTDFVYKAVEDMAEQDMPGSDWGIDYPDKLAEDLMEEQKCKK